MSSPHVLASLSAQGLECYQCMGVPIGTSCPSITCSYTDGFCIYQEAEVTEGKFPVASIKMGEGDLGEKVRAVTCCGPWLPSLQVELPGVGVGTPAKWGLLGSRDVRRCGS